MFRLAALLSLCLALTFAACKKDEVDDGNGTAPPATKTFSAQLNGQSFSASGQSDITGINNSSTGFIVWTASGQRTNATTTETILISAASIDSADFAVGSVFSSSNPAYNGFSSGSYSLTSPSSSISATIPDTPSIATTCTITAVDMDAQTWSGTFSFEVADNQGEIYRVENGEFSNVSFE